MGWVLPEAVTNQMKLVVGKNQIYERAIHCRVIGFLSTTKKKKKRTFFVEIEMIFTCFSAKYLIPLPTVFSWMKWQGAGWMGGEMGRKLAKRQFSEGSFLLRLAACHKCSPTETNTGPHGVQHVHRWLRW